MPKVICLALSVVLRRYLVSLETLPDCPIFANLRWELSEKRQCFMLRATLTLESYSITPILADILARVRGHTSVERASRAPGGA